MSNDLKEKIGFRELTAPEEPAADKNPGYPEWKRKKVEAALKQSEERSSMVSAKKVWERFGFER